MQIIGHLALVAAAVFTGVALYVSLVEQPARLGLDDRALLAEWKPSYKRGAMIQAPLALLGWLFGLIAWWQTGGASFMVGALVIVANWPWTLLAIKPTNDALMATEPASATPQTRALIEKWGKLHAVRSGLGAAATAAFLWGCVSG